MQSDLFGGTANSITLTQLQQLVTNSIRMTRGIQNVWVMAEFSDLRVAGGHCYMELIEKDASGTTRAKVRANIWASNLAVIRNKFMAAAGRDISSGMKVLVHGSVTHHNIYGLSFNITDIDPSYTLGDLERQRREILERLLREGVLDANKQIPVPIAPQRVAVITAEGAAGCGDFLNQLSSMADGMAIYPFIFPAVMQGERTVPSLLHALDQVEMTASMWDVVVIIRGGGATSDLNSFDNYDLARRVATFPLPVIVGIGHERDRCVLDEVAGVRCKTPTAAAAFIIDRLRTAYMEAYERVRKITSYVSAALSGEHLRLSNLSQGLPALARNVVLRNKMSLNKIAQSLPGIVGDRVSRQEMLLQQMGMRIDKAASTRSQRESMRLQRLDDMLRILSPMNTLKRGYSITRIDGKAVRSVAEAQEGSIIETTLPDGTLTSQILSNPQKSS